MLPGGLLIQFDTVAMLLFVCSQLLPNPLRLFCYSSESFSSALEVRRQTNVVLVK